MRRARAQGRETGGCWFFRTPGGGMKPRGAKWPRWDLACRFSADGFGVHGFGRGASSVRPEPSPSPSEQRSGERASD
ncbi:hypothetical protein PR202_gb18422 [Eleusine coracana subsp. coracana]|uniref:Uncharacterized protein n=1 Tax=Eleusine coracana subsp. coracana TaxID=191504 RepID=A0AAV5F5D2_ELECO|nr:hypothetical protein PR202_gb18422 [Eleusine coracana subsp. coracana]